MFQNSERRTTWIVLFLLVAAAVVSLTTSYLAHAQSNSVDYWSWLDGAAQNFSTEMMGAIVTFGLFELILGSQKAKREKAEQIAELQKRLVREAGSSSSNETAKVAVEYLRAEGWLTIEDNVALLKKAYLRNARLQGADLRKANLYEADLWEANLHGANLWEANLHGANLWKANLQQANLRATNLEQANLEQANLQATDLQRTNLQQANLEHANLQAADLRSSSLQQANMKHANLQQTNLEHANLEQANLEHANLEQANLEHANLQAADLRDVNLRGAENIERVTFDEKTVLPNAESIKDKNGNYVYDKYWTAQTDMTRYTNPEHPDFWEPSWVKWHREQVED